MNELGTPNIIRGQPYTTQEIEHRSQKCSGYHAFLLYYFLQFKVLTIEQKEALLVANDILELLLDTASIEIDDSILAPWSPNYHEILRLTYCRWRLFNIELKQCWKIRTNELNSHMIPSKFDRVPCTIEASLYNITLTGDT